MRAARAALLILPALAIAAFGYSAYYTDPLTSINGSYWTTNGTGVSGTAAGLNVSSATGGSVISTVAVPDGSSDYEVLATMTFASGGGGYSLLLRATPDAYIGANNLRGTFYAIDMSSLVINSSGCSLWLAIDRSISGVLTALSGKYIGCRNGMEVRAWVKGGRVVVLVDGVQALAVNDSSIASGKPGFSGGLMPAGNGFTNTQLRPIDRSAPAAVISSGVASFALPRRVELQWKGADDGSGIGIGRYAVYRNGAWLGEPHNATFSDETVQPASTYSYTIYAADQHENWSGPTSVSVTTAPDGAIDSRRVGVRPDGAYWGGGDEQIDTRSGNLNFSIPILKAQGRGGWGVTFALNYNSQVWRTDASGDWKLGNDSGYGHGWRLMAGAVLPYYTDSFTVHHYKYIDSTGAEYRLEINTSGVWTSKESGVYVSYDANQRRLYFPDGSFWLMGAESSGAENDAGTLYPTVMQDTNGNQVAVRYDAGVGAAASESSSRITGIADARAVQVASFCTFQVGYNNCQRGFFMEPMTYGFLWDTASPYTPGYPDRFPLNVTDFSNPSGTMGRIYYFGLSNLTTLYSPVTGAAVGNVRLLTSVSGIFENSFTVEYTAQGGGTTGELYKYTNDKGGRRKWDYTAVAYPGGRTQREVANRYIRYSDADTDRTVSFVRDPDTAKMVHGWMKVNEANGSGQKQWSFDTTAGGTYLGLATQFAERNAEGQADLVRKTLTWTLDGVNRPYVSTVLSEQDPGQSYAATSKTGQTLDVWGNVTETKLYNFGNLTTAAKTYTNTYLTNSNYTSRGIRNRLVSSVLTDGTKTLTLVSNTYDVYSLRPECATSGPGFTTGLYGHPDTPRQWVDPGTIYRGNVTRSVVPGGWGCTAYYQTGMVYGTSASTGAQSSVNLATGTNYTVPASITAAGLTSTMNWDSALQETGVTGPHSETVSLSYDGYHRVTSVTDVSGTQGVSYLPYNSGTGAKAVVTETWGTVVTKKTVDGFGRVVKLEKGDTNGITSVVDTEYEACACTPFGKVRRVSRPHAPGAGAVWTTYSFDGLGRTTQVLAADGASTTAYLYQGNTVKVTDPAGKWKKMTLDAFGRIVQVNEPNPAGGADYVTSYSYDFVDHLVRAELPRPTGGGSYTQVRTWTYSDTDLRLQSQTQPETGATSFAYNSLGLLFSKSDAKGIRKELTYDDKQRVTAVRYYNTSDGSENTNRRVDSYYDTNPFDGTYTQNGAGRLTAISYKVKRHTGTATFTWLAANEQYSYSADGRLTKKKLVVNGVALEAQLGYDSKARLNSLTYPGTGGTYTYEYDSQSRLAKLKQGSTELVSTVQYGVAGELLQIDTETRQYNTLGQLTRITNRPPQQGFCIPGPCPPGPADLDLQYRYSATANNGQITSMKNWVSGEEVSYGYDSLSRLTSAVTTGPEWGLSWSWDGWGNRTAQSVTKGAAPSITLSYNAATNRINSSGYTYDGAGNLTLMPKGAGTLPMAYDLDNRLILAGTQGGWGDTGERYSYAPDNKRVYRKVIGVEERVAFWLGGQLLAEFTPNTGWTSVTLAVAYKYFGSRRVGEKNDRLGSEVSSSKSYYPFGEQKVVTVDGSYKFATYWRDSSTGLDYADQRYYSAGIGRFLTADPYQASGGVGDPGSWNRYGYVGGDPVNFGDPDGLNARAPWGYCSPDRTYEECVYDGTIGGGAGWGGAGGVGPYPGACNLFDGCWIPKVEMSPEPPPERKRRRTYFLTIQGFGGAPSDCYRVPANGGPVTREISYRLMFQEEGMLAPMGYAAVITEHLTGDLPVSGAHLASQSAPGWFPDQQSIPGGKAVQRLTQTFSARVDGTDVGLPVIGAFGGNSFQLVIEKHVGFVSINGNIGGRLDSKGRLIPGTYTPCN